MIKILQIEWRKLRGTQIFTIAGLLPLMAVFQGFFFYRLIQARNIEMAGGAQGWALLYAGCLMLFAPLVLPLLVALLTALVARIEHQQDSWKQLFALPVRREQVFGAKLLVSLGLCASSLVILSLGILAAGLISGLRGPLPWDLLVGRPALIFLVSLPGLAVQFYLSYRFHNVIAPLVIAAGLTLPAFLAAYSEQYWVFYPWAYPTVISLADQVLPRGQIALAFGVSLGLFALISAISLRQFSSRDIV